MTDWYLCWNLTKIHKGPMHFSRILKMDDFV